MPKPQPSALQTYKANKYSLIPLKRRGKPPMHLGWPNKKYKGQDQIEWMEKGNNVGVRLRAIDLIIDIDPRNFPQDELGDPIDMEEEFCRDLGIDFSDVPTVNTGGEGKGKHCYFTMPKGFRVRRKLDKYPGIDFKAKVGFVVAAGSIHPDTGKLYKWDPLNDDLALAFEAPKVLLDLIERPEEPEHEKTDSGIHSTEEVGHMLEGLDPQDFSDYEDWMRIMMACYHASDGDALDEFIEWSTNDPNYPDTSDVIAEKWPTCKGEGVSAGTLYWHLMEAGEGERIPRASAADDFTNEDFDSSGVTGIPPDDSSGVIGIPPEDADDDDSWLDGSAESSSAPIYDDGVLDESVVRPSPGDYSALAALFLQGTTWQRIDSEWFRFIEKRNVYKLFTREDFQSAVWRWCAKGIFVQGKEQNQKLKMTQLCCTNIVHAAQSQRANNIKSGEWLSREPGDPKATELLSVRNGCIHIPTAKLICPGARFFTTGASPVDFDPDAPTPVKWMKFLDQAFEDREDCLPLLREWFGYCLTNDTTKQKFLHLVGPPRSGKGVILRRLSRLVGAHNVSSPTLKTLSDRFSLEPLLGSQLAVVTDMRRGKNTDISSFLETLLRVVGEDSVSIQRKTIGNVETTLKTRFMIVSNEVLQIGDTSAALSSRMLFIRLLQSFVGRENFKLDRELDSEDSGILKWALEGLNHLNERGRFEDPEQSKTEMEEIQAATAPLKDFIDTICAVGPFEEVPKQELFMRYMSYMEDLGLEARSEYYFFANIRTAVVGQEISVTHRGPRKGPRIRIFTGIGLR